MATIEWTSKARPSATADIVHRATDPETGLAFEITEYSFGSFAVLVSGYLPGIYVCAFPRPAVSTLADAKAVVVRMALDLRAAGVVAAEPEAVPA